MPLLTTLFSQLSTIFDIPHFFHIIPAKIGIFLETFQKHIWIASPQWYFQDSLCESMGAFFAMTETEL